MIGYLGSHVSHVILLKKEPKTLTFSWECIATGERLLPINKEIKKQTHHSSKVLKIRIPFDWEIGL